MKRIVLGLLVAALAVATPARASLIGDTVFCTFLFTVPGVVCAPPSAIVNAGVEFSIDTEFPDAVLIDIQALAIQLIADAGDVTTTFVDGDQLVLSSLDLVEDPTAIITGVTLSGNVQNLALTDIAFGPHSVTVSLADSVWTVGSQALIGLTFSPVTVPEPGTLALVGIGLFAIGVLLRRR